MSSIGDSKFFRFNDKNDYTAVECERKADGGYSFRASKEGEWQLTFDVCPVIDGSETSEGKDKVDSQLYTGNFTLTYDKKYETKPLKGALSIIFDPNANVYKLKQIDTRASPKEPWTLSLQLPGAHDRDD